MTDESRQHPAHPEGHPAHPVAHWFGNVANAVARAAGKPATFALAVLAIVVWIVTGPVFGYSDTWQLIINTATTIITFLMVFLIQNSQNRDNAAIQVKLDELIRVSTVQNMFVGIERLTDEEIEELRAKCEKRAKQEAASNAKTHIREKADRTMRGVRARAQRAADRAG
ncbi:MAG: low affinity iron permease family protein [Gemmatimonas sp.]